MECKIDFPFCIQRGKNLFSLWETATFMLIFALIMVLHEFCSGLWFLFQSNFMKILPKISQPLKKVLKNYFYCSVKKLLLLLSQGANKNNLHSPQDPVNELKWSRWCWSQYWTGHWWASTGVAAFHYCISLLWMLLCFYTFLSHIIYVNSLDFRVERLLKRVLIIQEHFS